MSYLKHRAIWTIASTGLLSCLMFAFLLERIEARSVKEHHALLATATNPKVEPATTSEPSSGLGSVVPQHGTERPEVEIITIRPTGFEPTDIKRTQGRFLLVVNNQSGIHELAVQVKSDTAVLYEGRLPKGKKRWMKAIDPPPGRYILTESRHPERLAYLTITAR